MLKQLTSSVLRTPDKLITLQIFLQTHQSYIVKPWIDSGSLRRQCIQLELQMSIDRTQVSDLTQSRVDIND